MKPAICVSSYRVVTVTNNDQAIFKKGACIHYICPDCGRKIPVETTIGQHRLYRHRGQASD